MFIVSGAMLLVVDDPVGGETRADLLLGFNFASECRATSSLYLALSRSFCSTNCFESDGQSADMSFIH